MQNTSLYAPLLSDKVKLIEVQFWSDGEFCGQHYTYKCVFDVNEGDLIVVEARDHFQVVRVVGSAKMPTNSQRTYRWAVCNLHSPMQQHRDVLAWEENVVDDVETRRQERVRAAMLEAMGIDPSASDAVLALPVA